MNQIEIFNQTNENIEMIDELKTLMEKVCQKENIENVEFNIIFVNNEEIHQINKEWRGVDRETDVISFALEDEDTVLSNERVLGDIYISIDKAREQAKEYGHSLKREICFLSVHGFLHLLGYDHMNEEDEKVMFDKQKELLEYYGIKR